VTTGSAFRGRQPSLRLSIADRPASPARRPEQRWSAPRSPRPCAPTGGPRRSCGDGGFGAGPGHACPPAGWWQHRLPSRLPDWRRKGTTTLPDAPEPEPLAGDRAKGNSRSPLGRRCRISATPPVLELTVPEQASQVDPLCSSGGVVEGVMPACQPRIRCARSRSVAGFLSASVISSRKSSAIGTSSSAARTLSSLCVCCGRSSVSRFTDSASVDDERRILRTVA
jgi:hypothetical protein